MVPPPAQVKYVNDLMQGDLLYWRDLWFAWLLRSTKLVVAGLILEGPELIHELQAMRNRVRIEPLGASLREFHTPDWVKIVALLGWLFIVAGVGGEWITDAVISDADSNIQAFNNALLAETTKEAGNAAKSATIAHEEADAATLASGKAQGKAEAAGNTAGQASRRSNEATTAASRAINAANAVEAEAQKTKSDLINLAICNAPRVITEWAIGAGSGSDAKSYVDALRPMAGQIVFIEVVPDAEARRAALSIARALGFAQWSVKQLTTVDGLADGVSVQPSTLAVKGLAKGEIPNMAPYWHANEVAGKLVDFLHSYNWQAARGWPTDRKGHIIDDEKILPLGTIRIQVGLYPAAVYVSPPGQKDLTSLVEKSRRERDKDMADLKRRQEEEFARLPPETRKNLEHAAEEYEAKIKDEMSNGPCQVLNPSF